MEDFIFGYVFYVSIPITILVVLFGVAEGTWAIYHFIEDKKYKGCLLRILIEKTTSFRPDRCTDMGSLWGAISFGTAINLFPGIGPLVLLAVTCILSVIFLREWRRKKKDKQDYHSG